MVLAFEGDSTMTRTCLPPPVEAAAPRGLRVSASSPLPAGLVGFLRAGGSPDSGFCFLRGGTAVSWVARERKASRAVGRDGARFTRLVRPRPGGVPCPRGCRCVVKGTRYNHQFERSPHLTHTIRVRRVSRPAADSEVKAVAVTEDW